jgi:hypothetical protein
MRIRAALALERARSPSAPEAPYLGLFLLQSTLHRFELIHWLFNLLNTGIFLRCQGDRPSPAQEHKHRCHIVRNLPLCSTAARDWLRWFSSDFPDQ